MASGLAALYRRFGAKPDAAVVLSLANRDIGDAGAEGSLAAGLDHRRDAIIVASHQRLDAAVGAVAHPAAQAEPARPAHHPGAVADPLYPAGDAQPHAPHGQFPRELPYSNSRITWSTARLSPGFAR